ncbi:MAG: glycosyltransferase family 2 protein [Selenomonas ruminantium]|jgi:glycosyltransferase involved in cell wall biosynthesis|nr:glycosyltransferase family 2 protein [Selenomonas ruminantium]
MISIIVPVYNAEKYLRECLDSVLAQTYTNLEIILIDDGSKDASLSICQEYARKDKRIIVHHKENSGVSDTRNYGIEHAKGDFISFCDSDDIIDQNLYLILYNTMKEYDVDRVVSGYAYLYNDNRLLYSKPRVHDGKYEAHDILKKMIDDGTLSGFLFSGVNNSLFKKEVIKKNNIRFNKAIKYNEDGLFSFQYMLCSKSIYSLQSRQTYLYRQHDESSTKKRTVGDKYGVLRKKLWDMQLNDMNIDFKLQMERRTVTEALWQILDISKNEIGVKAIEDIRNILKNEEVQKCMLAIRVKDLNMYKKFYYILMKLKMSWLLYYSSRKLFPILSKFISR